MDQNNELTTEQMAEQVQNNLTTTPDEISKTRDQAMFERYVQDSGSNIPENFKSAGDWFNSLTEAQANYTRGQQEIAELKKQYAEEGTANPDYTGTEDVTQVKESIPEPTGDEELRLTIPEENPVEEAPAPSSPQLTQEMWNDWSGELASTGEMSEDTMSRIQEVTNFPREVIEDYISAHKSKMRESFGVAAEVVGGKDKLKQIFDWAENTLSPADQMEINKGLASSSYEVTLRGLASMYEQKSAQASKEREPSTTPGLENVAASDQGVTGYRTKREFQSERNNPRFKLDPQYRAAVESRMLMTDFNTLPL